MFKINSFLKTGDHVPQCSLLAEAAWQQWDWLTMASPPIVPSELIHRESLSVSGPLGEREKENRAASYSF